MLLTTSYVRGWWALPGFGLVFDVKPMYICTSTHTHTYVVSMQIGAAFYSTRRNGVLLCHSGTLLPQDWFYRWAHLVLSFGVPPMFVSKTAPTALHALYMYVLPESA